MRQMGKCGSLAVANVSLHSQGGPVDFNPPIWLQCCSMAIDHPVTSWPKY
jgi:hypothetical protein